jgi:pimeloyl-ACP methyl ester carboxylesterase
MPTAAGIHYFLHDSGSLMRPPLLLLHDAGRDHLAWPSEIRRLPGQRVYTLDLPGHGKNEGLGRQFVEEYACAIAGFMDAAGLSRAVLGGHGMGGAIALAMALDYPDRVAGIILVSTGARLPVPASVLENGANPSTLPRAINAWQELSFEAMFPEDQRDAFCRQLSQVRQTMLYGDWMACSRFDVTDRLGTIRKPTLVICGTADRLTPLALSRTLASHIPEAALQTVDRAGHMLIVEQPQRLAKLINVFLGTIPFTPGV